MSATYSLVPVDTASWGSKSHPGSYRLSSASVTKSTSGQSPLIDSMQATVRAQSGYEWPRGWYRLTERLSTGETHPVGTFWTDATGETFGSSWVDIDLEGKSTLLPLQETNVPAGTFFQKGANATRRLVEMIQMLTPAPVKVAATDPITLADYLVLDSSYTYLDALWQVLDSAEWVCQIAGNGEIRLLPKPTASVITVSSGLGTDYKRSWNLSSIPNAYRVVDESGTEYVARNYTEGRYTSYSAIGRWVEELDSSPSPLQYESLNAYARRMLQSASTVQRTHSYTRPYESGTLPFDMITISDSRAGLSADVRIESQRIACDGSRRISETALEEIEEFTA